MISCGSQKSFDKLNNLNLIMIFYYTLVFRKSIPLNKYISVNQNLYLETYHRPALYQVRINFRQGDDVQ